jgi:hypothetical protein
MRRFACPSRPKRYPGYWRHSRLGQGSRPSLQPLLGVRRERREILWPFRSESPSDLSEDPWMMLE